MRYAAADAVAHRLRISEACSSALGEGFLQRFQGTLGTMCGATAGAGNEPMRSSVQCAAYPVEGLGLACSSTRLVVDAARFMGAKVPKGQQDHSKYMPAGAPGSVQLNCHVMQRGDEPAGTKTIWQSGAAGNLQKDKLPWFTSALAEQDGASNDAACSAAGAHVVQHPVMFVSRLDTTNPYHHTQSIVQAFLTLAVLNSTIPQTGLQVVLADHFDPGPFTGIWQRLSHPRPVLSLDSPAFASNHTCIAHGIHAHYVGPGRAFLGYEGIGTEKTCPSTILMAFAHWQRYLFKDVLPAAERAQYAELEQAVVSQRDGVATSFPTQGAIAGSSANISAQTATDNSSTGTINNTSSANDSTHRRLNVVWLSRAWFSRSMAAGGGLTGWQASRDMSHDEESHVVRALQQAVLDWNSRACTPAVFGWWQQPHAVPPPRGCVPTNVSFDFRFVELSVQDLYPEQVLLLTRTAVLVGIHGAALTNMVWMRPHRGSTVEFGAGGNFHYRNMAHMLGHKHFRLDGRGAAELAHAVTEAMDHVSSKYG